MVNVSAPNHSYIEALISNRMVFGEGALGRKLNLDEVMRLSW
jgi:hypothetical protein